MMLYRIFRVIFRLLFRFVYRLEVAGKENVPREGAVILCANHISNLDPPIVAAPLDRKVHYMAKEELFRIPLFNRMIAKFGAFPVKRGGVSKEAIRTALELLKAGEALGIFPEGTRRNAGGMGKKGAASLALKSGATVIPAAIIGNYRPFRKMKIIYGSPVDLQEFAVGASSQDLEKATEKIMARIREMLATN